MLHGLIITVARASRYLFFYFFFGGGRGRGGLGVKWIRDVVPDLIPKVHKPPFTARKRSVCDEKYVDGNSFFVDDFTIVH